MKPKRRAPQTRRDWRQIVLLLLLIVCALNLVRLTSGQGTIGKKPIQVIMDDEVAEYWKVIEAGVREDYTGTIGYVELQNVAEVSLSDAILYGEYFDSTNRLCFSLVFSLSKSARDEESIKPGESRLIEALGFGLFPALDAEKVKLYLIQLGAADRSTYLKRTDVAIWGPVTVQGGANSVQLSQDLASRQDAILDLALARVTVNEAGVIESDEVLEAATNEIRWWFKDLVEQHVRLFPETQGEVPQKGEALILARLVLHEKLWQQTFYPPRMSSWIKTYVQGTKGGSLPPVTSLVFTRPPAGGRPLSSVETAGKASSAFELFELTYGDSYWSQPVVQWVGDPSMPNHLRRQIGFPQR